MSREEVRKLLGGYATGTLTAEEQQVLFEAALEDQEIFDALAREQGLRDLLRDPSARAEVLAALDDRPARGVWTWLRSPWVAGLAMAGVAAVGVAVWQISRQPAAKQALIAENRSAVPAPVPPPQPPEAKVTEAPVVADKTRRKEAGASKLNALPRRDLAPAAAPTEDAKQKVEITAAAPEVAQAKPAAVAALSQQPPAAPPQAAPPPPQFMQNQANQNQAAAGGAQLRQQALDARALFYGQPSAPGARSAFAPSQADQAAVRKKTESATGGVAAGAAGGTVGGVLGGIVAAAPLGVRASILQGDREIDPSTPLHAGDSVKLKLIPNADGFLYVTEGDTLLANGPVKRLEAFETPVMTRDAPGQRQFRVTLTRSPMATDAVTRLAKDTRANLVETKAERESATYVVQNVMVPAPQPVVVPVTLTWQ